MLHWVLRFGQCFSKKQNIQHISLKITLANSRLLYERTFALLSPEPYPHTQAKKPPQRTQTTNKSQGKGPQRGPGIPTFPYFQIWGSVCKAWTLSPVRFPSVRLSEHWDLLLDNSKWPSSTNKAILFRCGQMSQKMGGSGRFHEA